MKIKIFVTIDLEKYKLKDIEELDKLVPLTKTLQRMMLEGIHVQYKLTNIPLPKR